jgi:hypothetical protein
MDPELVKLIQQAVRDGLTSSAWIVMVTGIIAAGLGAFVGAYLKGKAEHLATKEDFGELLRQMEVQTSATEQIKADVAEKLNTSTERLKAELSVWADFRNDVLKDMWTAHRAVVGAMSNLVLATQRAAAKGKLKELEDDITEYRSCVHRNIDLLTPRAVILAQEFLSVGYEISGSRRVPDDANSLKDLRRKFYEDMALHFHLGEVMPWTVHPESASRDKPK